ncbi:MAG: M42 family metallopeptidase [Calditrichaeota bacterium]|nr:M42 family metallopeptidase [Calditrichota bacterium]MCB9368018.1 M42 family metallopeptidase [Calditrichota bacterium]
MSKNFYVDLLRELSDAFGPSGHEDDVRALIRKTIGPWVSDIREDALGNLIAFRPGKNGKRLMLDAHTDEIGIMVRHIDSRGFLRFATIGGWDDRMFPGHRVMFKSRAGNFYYGVIGMTPPHVLPPAQREKAILAEDYFIDIGADSLEEAEALGAAIGDPGTLAYPFREMKKDVFNGKAFDDRVGCLTVISLLKALHEGETKTEMDVYANFATSEEVGLRGAGPAAFGIDPHVAIAFEGTIGSDFPGVPEEKRPCAQRKGPVITIADKSVLVPRRMVNLMTECAQQTGVPYQYKMPLYGGTNAGSIHTTRAGILSGCIATPCRYIHSPNTTLYWPDFENTLKLAKRVVERAHELA